MKRKLDYAREIVSGLAMEDYDRISHAARELALISQESIWNAVTTEPYLRESSNFRASAARLQEMAKAKNLDGSALAYFEVTLNCVRCHQYLRTAQRADQDE
jgi:cytochrome c556